MKRLVIIDGHAILYRAYHALPPLTTSKGEMVNAVYGFASMLLRVIVELKPTHLVVAFDTPAPTFRNKLYKQYQSQRPKADDDFISQIAIVHDVVSEMGIPIFEVDGYEADDVIGTLATEASTDEVIIVTGDRDMLQLVNDKIRIYMPVKGLSESKLYGAKEVEEKFGIKPSQIIDYKALVGDSADNYPGVSGIGPKTASTLLNKYHTLEELYKKIKTLDNENIRKKLEENVKLALVSKKLATILTDAPIKFKIDQCEIPNLDRPNVHELFERFEFRSLIPRLSGGIKNNEVKIKNEKKEIKQETQQIQLF